MNKIKNEIMLITYADSLGKDLQDLKEVLDEHYSGAIGGVHILPFFPSSGDRGFAPMRYDVVDEAFGTIEDVKKISEDKYLMYDFMVNHISRQSEFFKDFQEKKDESKYKDFFIRYKDFWENGEPTEEQVDAIYKRKPRAPYYEIEFNDGSKEKVWCTFAEEQIDLNMDSKVARDFIKDTLISMCKNGAAIIRLDAFAYAIKKQGTSCFFIEPEMWNLLYEIQDTVKEYGVDILPEIHEHYTIQHKISEKGFWIYDFALPVLVLNALDSGKGENLKKWLDMSPMKQFTTLDTHDGIGIVDVKDLMTDEEIEGTKEAMFTKGANVKKIYNTAAYNNLDIYQVNCTYYSALGNNDKAYLLARAIQFFAPGIPQVYYVGMLAGENDIELMESTKNGRDINRHYYSKEEIRENFKNRKIVNDIRDLMKFRNSNPAFGLDGECITKVNGSQLVITRKCGNHTAVLKADLKSYVFTIE
ncbi:sucrose phosphorylase [Clostridium beijerinckii]|uniref:Sucrose 6(F)-phosphate phosphorylase n=1 Tax=Clostridium beijerinckii TaxID=1520 RepID=A0A1S8S284_CLOBE|nr:sucrose phosphorylase [Clostridium beijerinckii]NRY59581.1 sucrose phosphorylase [Clostridium beijerinckii]OOM59557.1 sucrose phosphorylase [Clostridium beijerinckii]